MTEKIMEWTPGNFRKMRKADQMRWNAEMKCFEVFQIDVPLELEQWEKDGLAKQAENRKKRKNKSVETIHESSLHDEPNIEGNGDERDSGIPD